MRPSAGAPTAEELIRLYGLVPHPEGGYYRETHRSIGTIPKAVLPAQYCGPRHYSTAVLFLLPEGSVSRLHRLLSDELWHFHLGGPLELFAIHPDGKVESLTLGQDVLAGQKLQHAVSAGCWFGAAPLPGSGYSFLGATVAPGFDFKDFQLADSESLASKFPHAREIIRKLA
ncbi:MAG: cupin domain-containing protein [Elusimicrobia bacterium]|nr:cupin domain-containing protein [Elusimicrobiota bacterium]